jgi:hypothetical protein
MQRDPAQFLSFAHILKHFVSHHSTFSTSHRFTVFFNLPLPWGRAGTAWGTSQPEKYFDTFFIYFKYFFLYCSFCAVINLLYFQFCITGFLEFVHRLICLKEYNVLKNGFVSVLRWKNWEYLLCFHLKTETNSVSETRSFKNSRRRIKFRNPVMLIAIYHRKNRLELISKMYSHTWI